MPQSPNPKWVVQGPDGKRIQFPDQFTDQDVDREMGKLYPTHTQQTPEDVFRHNPAWQPWDADRPASQPQTPGFLPSVTGFMEGTSPMYQDQDPVMATVKRSLAPVNVAKGLGRGAAGAISTTGDIAADMISNPNWFQTMPAGQRPSTMQKFATDPAREMVRKAEAAPTFGEKIGYYTAAGLPLLGPWLASKAEEIGHGNVGGPVGEAIGAEAAVKGTKAATKWTAERTLSLPVDANDFLRRSASLNTINRNASGTLQQSIQRPLNILGEKLKAEGARHIANLTKADVAAQLQKGQGTISVNSPNAEMEKAKAVTGYEPTPAERAVLDNAPPNTLMTFDQVVKARSKIGEALEAAKDPESGNPKFAKMLAPLYDGLTQLGKERAEELGGDQGIADWNHYNNEFNAYFKLKQTGISKEMLKPIGEQSEAIPRMQKFSTASVEELQKQMQKYGMDPAELDKAQRDARSIVEADKAVNGKALKAAYRVILGGGAGAAVAVGVIAAMHGGGIYGFIPMAMAAHLGAKAAGVGTSMEMGALNRRLRVNPDAPVFKRWYQEYTGSATGEPWQVRPEVEGPREPIKYPSQDEKFKPPPQSSPPPGGAPPSAPTNEPSTENREPTAEEAANNQRLIEALRQPSTPKPEPTVEQEALRQMEERAWDESLFRKGAGGYTPDAGDVARGKMPSLPRNKAEAIKAARKTKGKK
jgi:hypothetical protein